MILLFLITYIPLNSYSHICIVLFFISIIYSNMKGGT